MGTFMIVLLIHITYDLSILLKLAVRPVGAQNGI